MVEHYSHIRDEATWKAIEALDAANSGMIQQVSIMWSLKSRSHGIPMIFMAGGKR